MRSPVLWIVIGLLLLFGVLAVSRLLLLLARDAEQLARRARTHTAELRRAADALHQQVTVTADRTARLTHGKRRV